MAVATLNAVRAADGHAASTLADYVAAGSIEYIPFPESLRGKYQSYTQADMSQLRKLGYREDFLTVEAGVARYMAQHLPGGSPDTAVQ